MPRVRGDGGVPVKPPVCCMCEDKDAPAPYAHPIDAKLRLCQSCRAQMQFAEDLADSRAERRIGDAGERALIRAGRQPKGGR